jgi:hypothetical protein
LEETSSSFPKLLYENLLLRTVSQGSLLAVHVLTDKIYPQIIFGGVRKERRLEPRTSFLQRKISTT